MDQRERIGNFEEGIRTAIQGEQTTIWTAIPAIVQAVDFSKMTCQVQPAIQAYVRAPNGTQTWLTIKNITDVPIVFPSVANFILTLPLAIGDEVLVVFSSRCIDQWWQSGSVGIQAELRMHDFSDGFAIPGPRSLPNVVPSISSTTAQLRLKDGSAYVELTPAGAVNILAPGGVKITGTLEVTELVTADNSVVVTGSVDASGEVTGNGIPLSTHVHTDVQSGSDDSGPPL